MKKRYAVVGVSHRALTMFINPILGPYADVAELVAFVDLSADRMRDMNALKKTAIPCYTPEQFDRMVAEAKPDVVIVATIDCTHHDYIIRALAHDLDVYCEKPLTTDAAKARAILAAEAKSKGRVTVTFNYRYEASSTQVRSIIQAGGVGKVVSLDLNWYLDTYHGSSYFMRWNRVRANSGGLNVHKATHHFDLLSWWIGQKPVEVFAYGALNFFGKNGPRNPRKVDGRVCPACPDRKACAYYMRWHRDEWRGATADPQKQLEDHVAGLQASFSHYKNANARRCIYDSEIDIEDTYTALIKFDGGATATYSLNGSVPFEGFRLGINGLDGRLEYESLDPRQGQPMPEPPRQDITLIKLFGERQTIRPVKLPGSHGGADPLLQDDLFRGRDPGEPVVRMAPLMDGVLSVLTGVALHTSMTEHRPVTIRELLEAEKT
jgi:predicted dehydrogenase